MTRKTLDKELQELDDQIKQLGFLVYDALGKALQALETGDLAQSGRVIEADVFIDNLRAAIEEHTIRLLTLQQPLGGRDLRYLTAALRCTTTRIRCGWREALLMQSSSRPRVRQDRSQKPRFYVTSSRSARRPGEFCKKP